MTLDPEAKGASPENVKGPLTKLLIGKGPVPTTPIRTINEARTAREPTARILHGTARHFVLCSAHRCQSSATDDASDFKKCLILLGVLVDAQGIEPWTSPV